MATPAKTKRRGHPPAKQLSRPDHPYTMKLPDGRTLFVEIPGRWVTRDRSGKPAFSSPAVQFLDRVRVLAMPFGAQRTAPSPGYITTLREALGLTQKEMGERLGVDKMTVSRWERGTIRPRDDSLASLERLRRQTVRKGVTIPS
ncbi:MAG: helix-turn-helix domain-containing protein [Phycisphaerae bacterium]|nr:helix-turn-helix domain-containing protein [Phycisphaerae bacterium]